MSFRRYYPSLVMMNDVTEMFIHGRVCKKWSPCFSQCCTCVCSVPSGTEAVDRLEKGQKKIWKMLIGGRAGRIWDRHLGNVCPKMPGLVSFCPTAYLVGKRNEVACILEAEVKICLALYILYPRTLGYTGTAP